ncbi:MAG TPA: hypothetical protein DCX34_00055 [Roseovarius sp.]|nr:hypothetical protein [Roseovarius sp.]
MNLDEYEKLKEKLANLRQLISAGQVDESELLITMEGFDFSAMNPLIQQGFFHYMLGADKTKKYFAFVRFFNNNNAKVLTEILRNQHQAGKSISFLSYIQQEGNDLADGISEIRESKLRRGLMLGNR